LRGIDGETPQSWARRRRQNEGDPDGVGVEHQVQVGSVLAVDQTRRAFLAGSGPIRVVSVGIEPLHVTVGVESFPTQDGVRPTKREHATGS
jgi:hypothetical protein